MDWQSCMYHETLLYLAFPLDSPMFERKDFMIGTTYDKWEKAAFLRVASSKTFFSTSTNKDSSKCCHCQINHYVQIKNVSEERETVYSSIRSFMDCLTNYCAMMATDDASISGLQIPYCHWYSFHKINSPSSNDNSYQENNALTDCWNTNRV